MIDEQHKWVQKNAAYNTLKKHFGLKVLNYSKQQKRYISSGKLPRKNRSGIASYAACHWANADNCISFFISSCIRSSVVDATVRFTHCCFQTRDCFLYVRPGLCQTCHFAPREFCTDEVRRRPFTIPSTFCALWRLCQSLVLPRMRWLLRFAVLRSRYRQSNFCCC